MELVDRTEEDRRTSAASHADKLSFDTVCFGEGGAAELDGRQAVVFVPRSQIQRLELAFTSGVHHPLIVGGIGVAVLAFSLAVPAWAFMSHARTLRVYGVAAFAILGVWLVSLAVRKRWVVIVHTHTSRRHLIFQGSTDRLGMETFLAKVRARFGYL